MNVVDLLEKFKSNSMSINEARECIGFEKVYDHPGFDNKMSDPVDRWRTFLLSLLPKDHVLRAFPIIMSPKTKYSGFIDDNGRVSMADFPLEDFFKTKPDYEYKCCFLEYDEKRKTARVEWIEGFFSSDHLKEDINRMHGLIYFNANLICEVEANEHFYDSAKF